MFGFPAAWWWTVKRDARSVNGELEGRVDTPRQSHVSHEAAQLVIPSVLAKDLAGA
jgi:hypothetical protein